MTTEQGSSGRRARHEGSRLVPHGHAAGRPGRTGSTGVSLDKAMPSVERGGSAGDGAVTGVQAVVIGFLGMPVVPVTGVVAGHSPALAQDHEVLRLGVAALCNCRQPGRCARCKCLRTQQKLAPADHRPASPRPDRRPGACYQYSSPTRRKPATGRRSRSAASFRQSLAEQSSVVTLTPPLLLFHPDRLPATHHALLSQFPSAGTESSLVSG